MGRKNWKLEGEQECSAKKSDCLEEQEVRKLNDHEVKENREKNTRYKTSTYTFLSVKCAEQTC